jgi:hypothetical protein
MRRELAKRRQKEQNLDFDSTILVSSHGKPRWAAASYSLGHEVNKTNTNDNDIVVHNIEKENTEAADVRTNSEMPRDMMMLLRQSHLTQIVSSDNSSLTPSSAVRQKVKFDLTQTMVASLSHRKFSSRVRTASTKRLAVEVKVKGEKGSGCTHVRPIYKTGSGSRINLMYKSTIRFWKELKQLVTIQSFLTTLQIGKHFPKDHQQMMIKFAYFQVQKSGSLSSSKEMTI